MPYPDPGELYSDMVEQIFGSDSTVLPSGVLPPMSGFVWNYGKQPAAPAGDGWPSVPPVPGDIMQYYSQTTLPISSFLATQFAVCDMWFASGPVQTLANRIFTHCGTPSKISGTNTSRVNNPDFAESFAAPVHRASIDRRAQSVEVFAETIINPPVHDKTIFHLLDEKYPHNRKHQPLNWKVYYHDAPLSALCSYVYEHWDYDRFSGGNVFHFHEDLHPGQTNFEYDIRHGHLPKYSFIEPRYSDEFGGTPNSNHPGGAGIDFFDPNGESLPPPISVTDGEQLLSDIYNILCKYPETFAKTLLVVIYDEHGGVFDHIPPPSPAVSPFKTLVDNFNYDRYGVRVPAIFINPFIAEQTVYPRRTAKIPIPNPPFDHTSLLSTLIAQFELTGTLTPRVAVAPALEGLIPANSQPRPCPAPPDLPADAQVRRVSPQRPPVTNIPRQAKNLAGVLAPLYMIEEAGRRKRQL